MKNDENLQVEAIKLAVGTTSYIGYSINQIYKEAIKRLKQYYIETKEMEYLQAAVLHIRAYMEMGYDYSDNQELFDYVLKELKTDREIMFPKNYFIPRKVKLQKSKVRKLILKWPPSKYRIGINEVVEDIIVKVTNKEVGIHYYNSNPAPNNANSSGDLYELVISESDAYFHDIKRRKYFTFID